MFAILGRKGGFGVPNPELDDHLLHYDRHFCDPHHLSFLQALEEDSLQPPADQAADEIPDPCQANCCVARRRQQLR